MRFKRKYSFYLLHNLFLKWKCTLQIMSKQVKQNVSELFNQSNGHTPTLLQQCADQTGLNLRTLQNLYLKKQPSMRIDTALKILGFLNTLPEREGQPWDISDIISNGNMLSEKSVLNDLNLVKI